MHSSHFPGQSSVDRILEDGVSERTESFFPEARRTKGAFAYTIHPEHEQQWNRSSQPQVLIVDQPRVIIQLNITVGLDDGNHLAVHSEYESLPSGTLPMPAEMKLLLSECPSQMVNRISKASISRGDQRDLYAIDEAFRMTNETFLFQHVDDARATWVTIAL